jgi:hypothetical protein
MFSVHKVIQIALSSRQAHMSTSASVREPRRRLSDSFEMIMPIKAFYRHIADLIESIDDCAKKCRILPCLTLLYSGIDVMASLDAEPGEGVQTIFVRWVDKYLLQRQTVECTAIDLYAARCGIVHTFTADSDLYKRGKAKKIAYAWGLGKASDLKRANVELGFAEWRSIHVGDLVQAFRNAIATHLEHIETDPASKARFERASGLWFNSVDGRAVTDFLVGLDSGKHPQSFA